ncbi:MAG: DUF748 domain-containing protein [Planctomycetia bacterium]|nr:DUF748 domain-containing protein [Planctomycetia bacterium]
MTALLIILAPLAVELFAAGLAVLLDFLISLGLLGYNTAMLKCRSTSVALRRSDVADVPVNDAHSADRPARHRMRILVVPAALLAVPLAAACLVQAFWIDDVVRGAVTRACKKSGIEFTAGKVNGNLFTGSFLLEDVRLSRSAHEQSTFDLSIGRVWLDVSVTALLTGRVRFSHLHIDSVEGDYVRHQVPTVVPIRKQFEIDDLRLRDAVLAIRDETPASTPVTATVTVTDAAVAPLRSRYALFDILYHSQMSGTIDEGSFAIEQKRETGETLTSWRMEGVEISKLSPYLGKDLSIVSGKADLCVEQRWHPSKDAVPISVDGLLVLTGGLSAKTTAGGWDHRLKAQIEKHLGASGGTLPLAFSLSMDRRDWANIYSAETVKLWDMFGRSIRAAIAKVSSGGAADAEVKAGVNRLRELLKRRGE